MLPRERGSIVTSWRETWLSALCVFALAVVVRAIAAAAVQFPVPEDTAYYVDVAGNLVGGRGLVSDALWNYQGASLAVPRPAFELWMPLPSLLAAVPMALFGATFRAAQVFSVLTGGIVAVLAWRVGADVARDLALPPGRARTMAVGSGVAASVVGVLVVNSALPDSTMLFGAFTLAACLLMARVMRADSPPRPLDARVVAIGALIGLALLSRSEAIWLGFTWLVVCWLWIPGSARTRVALVAVPAIAAAIVFLPWAIRDWLVFGTPMPGQALNNALYVSNWDVFAYKDPPTLARYLAQGPAALVGMRVAAGAHNLLNVLVLPAMPTGIIGLVAIPWTVRHPSLRPLAVAAGSIFLATTLIFPVSTVWGTFLHAAAAIHVLLVVSSLVALDSVIVWAGRRRGWTRPVAWLGPAVVAIVATPLLGVAVSSLRDTSTEVKARYAALPAALNGTSASLNPAIPVIADHPIWLAAATHVPALALPDESPSAVLDLARRTGAKVVVVQADDDRQWPGILTRRNAAASCFAPVAFADTSAETSTGDGTSPLAQTRVFLVVCR